MKLPLGDLIPDTYSSYSISTYTCRMTITLRIRSDNSRIWVNV